MITENSKNVNNENVVECQFGNAIKELKIGIFLKFSNIHKKKGRKRVLYLLVSALTDDEGS